MEFNHELVDKFLEAIFPLPKKFGMLIHTEDTTIEDEPYCLSEFEEAVHDIDSDASICFGMSKIVIVSDLLKDVVIKIPFNGSYEDGVWRPFAWASGSDSSDYCLAEYEKYKKLKDNQLDCFVAETAFYKTIDGVRVFIQEKITSENDLYQTPRPSQASLDLAKKWDDEEHFYMDSEWIANCLDWYGESKVKSFLSYCNNIDLDILEDMHGGNYGYRENEAPAILDYSNFLA